MSGANDRIRAAQRRNDSEVLGWVRRTNAGPYYRPRGAWSVAWWNALDRLRKAGRVRFDRRTFSGYAIVRWDARRRPRSTRPGVRA